MGLSAPGGGEDAARDPEAAPLCGDSADQHVRTSLRAQSYLAARRLAGGLSAAPRHVGLTEASLNEAAAGSCTE